MHPELVRQVKSWWFAKTDLRTHDMIRLDLEAARERIHVGCPKHLEVPPWDRQDLHLAIRQGRERDEVPVVGRVRRGVRASDHQFEE